MHVGESERRAEEHDGRQREHGEIENRGRQEIRERKRHHLVGTSVIAAQAEHCADLIQRRVERGEIAQKQNDGDEREYERKAFQRECHDVVEPDTVAEKRISHGVQSAADEGKDKAEHSDRI